MESKPEVDVALYLKQTKHKYQLKIRFSSFFYGEKKREFWQNFLWKNGLKRYHYGMFSFTWNRRICIYSGYAEMAKTKSLELCQITVQDNALHSSYWRLREVSKEVFLSIFNLVIMLVVKEETVLFVY